LTSDAAKNAFYALLDLPDQTFVNKIKGTDGGIVRYKKGTTGTVQPTIDEVMLSRTADAEEEEEGDDLEQVFNHDDDDDDIPLDVLIQSLDIEIPNENPTAAPQHDEAEVTDSPHQEVLVAERNTLPSGFKIRRSNRLTTQARVVYASDSDEDSDLECNTADELSDEDGAVEGEGIFSGATEDEEE
jgi:hypothetical protein